MILSIISVFGFCALIFIFSTSFCLLILKMLQFIYIKAEKMYIYSKKSPLYYALKLQLAKILFFLLTSFCMIILVKRHALANTKTFDVSIDTYTNFDAPHTNYGDETRLVVSNDDDDFLACSFVKFDPLEFPGEAEPVRIDSANFMFKVFDFQGGLDTSVRIRPASYNWSEDELTWANASSSTSIQIDTTLSLGRDWLNINITDIVNAWYTGYISNNGISICIPVGSNKRRFDFYSSESTTAKPHLYVIYNSDEDDDYTIFDDGPIDSDMYIGDRYFDGGAGLASDEEDSASSTTSESQNASEDSSRVSTNDNNEVSDENTDRSHDIESSSTLNNRILLVLAILGLIMSVLSLILTFVTFRLYRKSITN